MDFPKIPGSGAQLPPPIPRTRDQWLLTSLFLMGGFFLVQLLNTNFYELFNRSHFGEWGGFGSAEYFSDYRSLTMIPLAFIIDYFLDRRDGLVIGAFAASFGLLLMFIPVGLAVIPAMVFFGTGIAVFELSLFSYFGSRWAGGLLRKDSGYTFLVAAGLLGSSVGWFVDDIAGGPGNSLLLPVILLLLMLGTGVAAILMRKETLLVAEKTTGRRKADRALGSVLIGVLAIVSIIGLAIFSVIEPEREITGLLFTFLALVVTALGVVVLLTARNYSVREKISMLVLIGLSLLFWAVVRNSSAVMYDGWDFFRSEESGFSYRRVSLFSDLIPMVGLGILAVIWYFYPKKGRGEVASGMKLLGALLLVTLLPLIITGFSSSGGPSEGWYLIWAILFSISYVMVRAVFYSMVWKFSPVKFRTLGFAILFSGGYLVYRVRNTFDLLTGRDPWYSGQTFDTTTTIIAVLMLFAAGALVFIRLRKWEN